MAVDDSITREQLRQLNRKEEKKRLSERKKKDKYYKSLSKKKKSAGTVPGPETITAEEYRKLGDDTARRKAYANLKRWFHLYIKLRDLSSPMPGVLRGNCIACGKEWKVERYSDGSIMNPDQWSASHYFLANGYASVEFDERNVHLSCYHCNRWLSGNLALYKPNLVKKIGEKEFEDLERRKNNAGGVNILDMIKLKEKYMDKVKEEVKRLGIKL